jgi:lipoprotein-anchoring transpeptidase ErfK/SrfK
MNGNWWNAGSQRFRTLLSLCVLLISAEAGRAQTAIPSRSQEPIRRVLVSIPERKLAVIENGNVLRVFHVAVGGSLSPTPTGEFQIVSRLNNPTYYHTGVIIPPGQDNPIGPRWLGLNKKGYGIHGTNEPKSIGKAASHGCIRMRNRDIQQFFQMVSVGDVVEIRGERDEETTQLFGQGGVIVASAGGNDLPPDTTSLAAGQ